MANTYKDDSIYSLNGRDFCRLRPATYLGSNETSTQLVREVFSNSLDEFNIGHGNVISVYIDTNKNEYKVVDNGQGFPIKVQREDGETVLQAAFDVINTSGKYDDKTGVYEGSSLGLNGIGAKLTNFLSKSLTVYTSNGKSSEQVWFEDGIFTKRVVKEKDEQSGTIVTWVPDKQFFQSDKANIQELKNLFRDTTALCHGLTVKFIVDGVEETYYSENGLSDIVTSRMTGDELLSSRFSAARQNVNGSFDVCLTYSANFNESTTAYVNYGLTDSGIHITTLKTAFTAQLNKYAFENGFIKKEKDKIGSSELSEGLILAFNVKSKNVKYDSQTKTRVVDLDKSLINAVMSNDFYVWLNNNTKDAKLILDRALLNRKARQAAQATKDGIRNAAAKGKKFISLPTKLVDAFSKKRSECELFITEGDSASNGLKAKRDGKTQAVFPIRGKILSCRKATPDKVYANQEISNIVKAIGLDIDKSSGKLIYDSKKLRYGKIILAADADSDGLDIRLLLINMFWWLCPELVKNGHIYVAIPPLFRITTKKNEYIYLTGQEELEEYKKTHKNESFLINRNKGLGESDSSELATYLLRPETRNIQQLIVTDEKAADDLLECFMGSEVATRRDFLLEHGSEVTIDME